MIKITKLTRSDIPFFNLVRNQCAVEYLHCSTLFSIEDSYNWFDTNNPDYYLITYNFEKIGYFRTSNYSSQNNNMYIGSDLHYNWRGKGLGYKSYLKFIPFIFKKYKLNKISLEVLTTNVIAINLYKKLGFVFEGTKRKEIFKNDEYIDSNIMSMLYSEYIKIYECEE